MMAAALLLLAAALVAAAPAAASFSYIPPAEPPAWQVAPPGPPGSLGDQLARLLGDGVEVVWSAGADPSEAAPEGTADWREVLTRAGLDWRLEGDVLHVFPAGAAPRDVASPPAARAWTVEPGERLRDVLGRWGDEAGVEIVWLTDRRWRIDQGVTVQGDFAAATRALFFALSHLSHAPVAQFAASGGALVIVHRPPPVPEEEH